jgi:RNA polymerase sigma-70 factor (ECF subfamily)
MSRMERTGEGDSGAAFRELIASHRGRLVGVARRILGDPHEAEDVVQDTLAAVWQRMAEADLEQPRAYVYRAVEMNALKRRARRTGHVSLDAEVDAAEAWPDESDEGPAIDPVDLEDALDGLPENQQVVLRMKYYLGLTFREIGHSLEISANTAASRARYALEVLRRALRGAAQDEDEF